MLRPMFGMGASEILVILVVALLFLGPEKLPEAASKISKGIRDLRKQTRDLQQTIENDSEIGGAIRDLKSALRGDEPRPRPRPVPPGKEAAPLPPADGPAGALAAAAAEPVAPATAVDPATAADPATAVTPATGADPTAAAAGPRLPDTAGEPAPTAPIDDADGAGPDDDDFPQIRPAAGAVAKGTG